MRSTHGSSKYDASTGTWVPRRNFVVVVHSPDIVSLKARLLDDQRRLILCRDEREITRLDTSESHSELLNSIFSSLNGSIQSGPYRLVKCTADHCLTDWPTLLVAVEFQSATKLWKKGLSSTYKVRTESDRISQTESVSFSSHTEPESNGDFLYKIGKAEDVVGWALASL